MPIVFPPKLLEYINTEASKHTQTYSSYRTNELLHQVQVEYKQQYGDYINRSVLHDTLFISDTPLNQLNSFSVECNNIIVHFGFILYNSKKEPQLCCLGPCITTSFSEYRSSVFPTQTLHQIATKHTTFYKKIQTFVDDILRTKKASLHFSTHKQYMKEAFIICVIYHLYDELNWDFYNYNSNADYMNVFDTIIHPIRSYRKQYKKEIIDITTGIYTHISDKMILDFGCKITPLYHQELQRFKDPLFSVWRNLYINDITNRFILSNVSDHFILSFGWSLIDSSSKDIFTNQEIFNRIQSNDMIKKVTKYNQRMLEEVQKKKEEIGFYDTVIQKILNNILANDSILKSIDTLSDVSIIQLYENRDNTFYNYIYNFITYQKTSIVTNMISNHNMMKKFMFDLSYALLCLHQHGIIHYDLHVNNVIIDMFNNRHKKNQSNIFIIDQEAKHIFEVPTYGFSAHIIDFDRALLSTEHTFNVREFIHDMVYELTYLFPKMNKEKLIDTLTNDAKSYMIAFHLFSAFDFLKVLSILLNIMNFAEFKKAFKGNADYQKNIQFLKKIHKEALSIVQKVINFSSYTSLHTSPLFAYTVLLEHFKEFKISKRITHTSIYRVFDIHTNKRLHYSVIRTFTNRNGKIDAEITKIFKMIQKLEKGKKESKKELQNYIQIHFGEKK